jgi:hypothetical protein
LQKPETPGRAFWKAVFDFDSLPIPALSEQPLLGHRARGKAIAMRRKKKRINHCKKKKLLTEKTGSRSECVRVF